MGSQRMCVQSICQIGWRGCTIGDTVRFRARCMGSVLLPHSVLRVIKLWCTCSRAVPADCFFVSPACNCAGRVAQDSLDSVFLQAPLGVFFPSRKCVDEQLICCTPKSVSPACRHPVHDALTHLSSRPLPPAVPSPAVHRRLPQEDRRPGRIQVQHPPLRGALGVRFGRAAPDRSGGV